MAITLKTARRRRPTLGVVRLNMLPIRRTAIIIALTVLAIFGGYKILGAYKSAHDRKAQEEAVLAMAVVEEVKSKSGSYPSKFDPPPSRMWGILPGPEVTYHFDGANCVIYYNEWPLGPHNVLDCKTKEWRWED